MPDNIAISYSNMPPQPAVSGYIIDRLTAVDAQGASGTRYRVTIDTRHCHHAMGTQYDVKIERQTPGGRTAQASLTQTDLSTAVTAALDILLNGVRPRGCKRTHADDYVDGYITGLSHPKGTGLMRTACDEEIVFRRHDVDADGFADLNVGDRVWWRIAPPNGSGRLIGMSRIRHRRTLAR